MRGIPHVAAIVVGLLAVFVLTRGFAQLPPPRISFEVKDPIEVLVGDDAGPQALAVADVDKDGMADVIAINRDDGEVSVALGEGDGVFGEPEVFDLFGTPSGIVVADVASPFGSEQLGDIDGNLDIIVSDEDGGAEILLGAGDGTFSDADAQDLSELLDEADTIVGLAVADFDRNGRLDIALLDNEDSQVIFLCNLAGNYRACSTNNVASTNGDDAVDIEAGDFDGNGSPDVVILHRGSADFSVLYGNSPANGTFMLDPETFRATAVAGNEPLSLAVGQLNTDALDDIVIASAEQFDSLNTLAVISQNRNLFMFAELSAPGPSVNVAVTLGDIDDDSSIDAVFATIPVEVSQVGPGTLFGDGTGAFGTDQSATTFAQSMGNGRAIRVVDVGGPRGLPDIIQVADDGESIGVAINMTGEVQQTVTPGTPPTRTATTTGSPGPTNTPTATVPTPTITLTATPTAIPTVKYGRCDVRVGGQLTGIATGSLDGDGTADIAVTDAANDAVWVLFNTASFLGAVEDCAKGSHRIGENTPTPTPLGSAPLRISVGPMPQAIAAVDLDRDADVDLAVAASDGIWILRNNGSGVFTSEAPITVGPIPRAIIGDYPDAPLVRSRLDLNDDRFTDLVVADGRGLSILYGTAAGTFGAPEVLALGAATDVVAGKFDDNSSVDLAVVVGDDAFHLLQNAPAGSPTSSATRSPTPATPTTPATTTPATTTSATPTTTPVTPTTSGTSAGIGPAQFTVRGLVSGDPVRALTTGFFTEDRRPDIVVAQAGQPGRTQVFTFAGRFAFTAAGEFPSGSAPTAAGAGMLASANLSSDTDADAVVASGGQLTFGLGDGAGSFATLPDPFVVGAAPSALAVVDFDRIGTVEDVITANADGTLSFLLSSAPPPTPTATATGTVTQTGTITATPPPPPTATATITPTLRRSQTPTRTATATQTKAGVFALSGTGCSMGESGSGFPIQATGILVALGLARFARRRFRAGLLKRRHIAALVIVSAACWYASPSSAQVLEYTPCKIPRDVLAAGSSGDLGGIATGLLDGDTSPDLVLLYQDRIAIELTKSDEFHGGHCLTAVTASTIELAAPVAVSIALIDGDLDYDLAVASETRVDVLQGNGAGAFTKVMAPMPDFQRPHAIAAGDLNDDDRGDLVVGDDSAIKILLGRGRVEDGYEVSDVLDLSTAPPDSPVLAVRLADFNRDEALDIAAVDERGHVGIFLQQTDGMFPKTPSLVATVAVPRDLQVDDLGGGMGADLALLTSARLDVLLESDGSLTPADGAMLAGNSNPRVLALGLLDNDSVVDAVVTDIANDTLHLLLGDGAGGFEPAGDPVSTELPPVGVVLADVDGDGPNDIIAASGDDGSITVFLSSNPEPTVTLTPSVTATPTLTGTVTATSTATPTVTLTGTTTLTPTITETPSITPTVTETLTPGPTDTPTETPGTPTGTATRTFSASPTETFGAFAIQGEGCANMGGSRGAADAMPLVVLAALALLRRRARRV